MEKMDADVIIVGAGISGLSCATHLMNAGKGVLILEASNRIGGRIKSDRVDGFILDRGFQVLQTAYPEAWRQLNYETLDLKPFSPGVLVRTDEKMFFISDPVRRPQDFWSTMTSPIGNFKDRLKMLQLFVENRIKGSEGIFRSTDNSTVEFLASYGFSNRIIERFFKPFFAGACLDPDIMASSRVFRYLFNVFASGDAALPAKGMGEIPRQLGAGIPKDRIQFNMKVDSIDHGGLTLANGQKIDAKTIVLATEGPETIRLLKKSAQSVSMKERCLYFSAETSPIDKPFLILNGQGKGLVNNVAIPTLNASSYSSSGKHLIAAVVLGDKSIDDKSLTTSVGDEMTAWFGESVRHWEHIKTYHIDHALPDQSPPISNPTQGFAKVRDGIYTCGEYNSVPGIQWALLSGRMTAERIIKDTE